MTKKSDQKKAKAAAKAEVEVEAEAKAAEAEAERVTASVEAREEEATGPTKKVVLGSNLSFGKSGTVRAGTEYEVAIADLEANPHIEATEEQIEKFEGGPEHVAEGAPVNAKTSKVKSAKK